jgi:dipeptidyl aminopeptidase/acylaminoacyl peptidase
MFAKILNIGGLKCTLLIFGTLLVTGCETDKVSADKSSNEVVLFPYAVDESLFTQNTLREGLSFDSVALNNGQEFYFGIEVPEHTEQNKLPLIISLHGAKGQGEVHLLNFASPVFESMQAIVITPNKPNNLNWTHKSYIKPINSLVEQAIKHWPVDPNKIVIMGYSLGGAATWYLTNHFPEIYSAGVILAGSTNLTNDSGHLPMYLVHGTEDSVFGHQAVENAYDTLIKRGGKAQLHIAEGYPHFPSDIYIDYMTPVVDWLQDEVWIE